MSEILLKSASINGKTQNLLIKDKIIEYVGTDLPNAETEYDVKGLEIIPGVIDPHVHVRDLGQSEKENWTSASDAALRGGVTTVFDMPNNKPPTVNLKNLNLKRKKAESAKVNYKFNIAATAQNLSELEELLETKPKDVSALKLFLAGSNSDEYVDNKDVIKRIFDISQKYDLPVIVHTELQKCVEKYSEKITNPTVFDHNFMRNRECSIKGTELVISMAKEIGNKLYLAHISTAEEIEIIKAAKDKCRVYCEITPHHLLLNETILKSAGNFGKVNPPLRNEKDNATILQGIIDGTVDTIGTDHAPHLLSEKLKDYSEAPSGFPGLETALPLLLNEVNSGKFSLNRLIELTSGNTAKIFNLGKRGKIQKGFFADLTVIDMNKTWKIEAKNFKSKAKYSPYEGMTGTGDVVMTFVNGELKYER